MMPEGARVRVLGGFSSESEAPLSQLTRVACDSVVCARSTRPRRERPMLRKCGSAEIRNAGENHTCPMTAMS
jgi:hypothetical protein